MTSLLKNRRTKGAIAAFASSALAFGGTIALLGADSSSASSHRESPQLIADPQVDNTDLYAFVPRDQPNRVTFVANWIPFEEPAGGPNFYPFADAARYTIKIDNNGDAKPDITYRWKFSSSYRTKKTFLYNTGPVTSLNDPNLNFRQTYSLEEIRGKKVKVLGRHIPVAPSDVGAASMPKYGKLSNSAIRTVEPGERTFAGQADDPFFLDLRVFDLLYGANLSETGTDSLSGYDVNTIALQVPISDLTRKGDPVIGVWSTTDRPSMRVQRGNGSQRYSGKYVQVSRLGNPLVNEVVVPVGLKDAFNALPPVADASVTPVVNRVLNPEVPKLIQAIYGIKAPKPPRNDLFKVFLTGLKGLNKPAGKVHPAEMLRLNTSIKPTANPNRLGVLAGDNQGYPDGRRLTDDVVDIEVQALEGAVRTGHIVAPLAKGDGVNANDVPFRRHFPYVALPHSGSHGGPAKMASGTSPSTYSPGRLAAPGGQHSAAAASLDVQGGSGSPLAPVAATVGFALAGLGALLLRRSRRRVEG